MDKDLSYGNDYKYIPATSVKSGEGLEITPDIYYHTIQIVNIVLIEKDTGEFVLIDAGMPNSAGKIIALVEERYGEGAKPEALILTHGHFDHVGAAVDLVKEWDIPVFAHRLEIPYLTGQESYPKPDGTVEGGAIAKMSPLFPHEPINLGAHIHLLPQDGSVPFLPDFQWVHTPGHTPGHVSFFREKDGALIAGDAFVTVKQDTLYKVITQEKEINGPPRYLTPDWGAAWNSVRILEALQPSVAITGHGKQMEGEELSHSLHKLVENFDTIAIPDHGKYTDHE